MLGKHGLELQKKILDSSENLKRAKSDTDAFKSGSADKICEDKGNDDAFQISDSQKSVDEKQDQMQKAIDGRSI